MARNRPEKRRRPHIVQSRLSPEEAALVRDRAERAGISVSALIRHALLGQTPPRASRRPPADRRAVCRMIGKLGELAQALREATASGDLPRRNAQIEALHRDIADMCHACFDALGRRR